MLTENGPSAKQKQKNGRGNPRSLPHIALGLMRHKVEAPTRAVAARWRASFALVVKLRDGTRVLLQWRTRTVIASDPVK